jgi:hypothetical protein
LRIDEIISEISEIQEILSEYTKYFEKTRNNFRIHEILPEINEIL